ncbi:MAG: endonuclease/exonuclease/phosphatase family protein [Chlamydiales bacterium]|nr:endonuclease/exonuclease/phosphatase family protein [Chlamydiales bacterium]
MYICAMVLSAFTAALTTPLGIGLRKASSSLKSVSYIFDRSERPPKELPADSHDITLFSWNVCGIYAGYGIDNGGVVPFCDRKARAIEKIRETDADVVCLYEVFDIKDGYAIANELKEAGYTRFYFNMGTMAIGVSSGLFVASKYEIENPSFIPFTDADGRAKMTKKGFFSFDLVSGRRPLATIYSTHLNHSEEPERPTESEKRVRGNQMQTIKDRIGNPLSPVIVTGDLNMGDEELTEIEDWARDFQHQKMWEPPATTWPGDGFCKRNFPGKRGDGSREEPSGAINLDHTLVLRNGSVVSIETSLIDVHFDPDQFLARALSDHNGQMTRITLRA